MWVSAQHGLVVVMARDGSEASSIAVTAAARSVTEVCEPLDIVEYRTVEVVRVDRAAPWLHRVVIKHVLHARVCHTLHWVDPAWSRPIVAVKVLLLARLVRRLHHLLI